MKRAGLVLVGSSALVSGETYFSETFGEGWENRWTVSKWKESEGTAGTWETAAGKWSVDPNDKGLQTAEDSKFFGIAAPFKKFSNKGKEMIVQYQVKYEKDVECGGGYLKMGPSPDDLSTFGDPTAYSIMFGPDECGSSKRTHLIFNYDGKNVLKKTDLPYKQDSPGVSHLYRLTLRPDNTVKVDVDQEEVYSGSLKDDWELLKPKEIDDPEDKKPADWVDNRMMDDPADSKPADWVEDEKIIDPDAKKPEDWDDDEDGEWEAPKIDNPDYKGKWAVKRIDNPDYKGVWAPRKISNPEFVDNDALYAYEDFSFIGFDLWQVKGGTIFDNIVVTDSASEADEFAAKWVELNKLEKEELKKDEEKKAEEAKAAEEASKASGEEDAKEDDDDDEDEKEEM